MDLFLSFKFLSDLYIVNVTVRWYLHLSVQGSLQLRRHCRELCKPVCSVGPPQRVSTGKLSVFKRLELACSSNCFSAKQFEGGKQKHTNILPPSLDSLSS